MLHETFLGGSRCQLYCSSSFAYSLKSASWTRHHWNENLQQWTKEAATVTQMPPTKWVFTLNVLLARYLKNKNSVIVFHILLPVFHMVLPCTIFQMLFVTITEVEPPFLYSGQFSKSRRAVLKVLLKQNFICENKVWTLLGNTVKPLFQPAEITPRLRALINDWRTMYKTPFFIVKGLTKLDPYCEFLFSVSVNFLLHGYVDL